MCQGVVRPLRQLRQVASAETTCANRYAKEEACTNNHEYCDTASEAKVLACNTILNVDVMFRSVDPHAARVLIRRPAARKKRGKKGSVVQCSRSVPLPATPFTHP
mgnify:CR=1 FL=1